MVLRHTSTSFATLLRAVGAGMRLARTGKPAGKLARLRHAVRQAVQGTRAALAGPVRASDLAHHLPGSGSVGARVVRLNHSPPRHPFGPYGGRFRAAGFRPHAYTPRGAAIPAHVGLGSARTFATAPAAGAVHSAAGNVPIVLRAFTHVFDDEDKIARKPLPRGRRYLPYTTAGARTARRRTLPRTTPRHVRTASTSSKASITEQLSAYFPLRPVDDVVPLPPVPESLVTPGMTATLALPLAPALEAILAPTPRVPYADAEVGVSVLARLTHGVMPLHDAYSSYASSRVIPLLARLEALGLLDRRSWPHTRLELVCDNGAPDMLRIHFDDRSAGDVLALLGDQLDGEWFALTDHLKDHDDRLSAAEQAEILEDWDAVPGPTIRSSRHAPPPESPVELVMPTLDLSASAALATEATAWPSSPSESFPPSSRGSASLPDLMSGTTTPSMLDSWATSPTLTSSGMSRSLSFISSLDSLAYSLSDGSDMREFSDDGSWAASPPSEADILIESQHSSRSVAVEVSWLQPGLGLMDW